MTVVYLAAAAEDNAKTWQHIQGITRDAAMKDAGVREAFDAARQLLRDCSGAFIEITNAVELHLFEVYAAIELDTGRVEHVSDALGETPQKGDDVQRMDCEP
jgi:hypothetical protein